MKITWTPNPLNTIVELDEHEQEVFKLKIKINELMEDLGSASIHLDPQNASWIMNKTARRPEGHTLETLIEEVRKDYLDMGYMYGEDGEEHTLDKRVQTLLEHYLGELKGSHIGDCTCFAMSCSKCHAESMLGIDTIKGLGKHPGHKIQSAFSNGRNGDVWLPEASIDEAIERLAGYSPKKGPTWEKFSQADFDSYVPRWTAEAKSAHDWLVNYRNEHFGEKQ